MGYCHVTEQDVEKLSIDVKKFCDLKSRLKGNLGFNIYEKRDPGANNSK